MRGLAAAQRAVLLQLRSLPFPRSICDPATRTDQLCASLVSPAAATIASLLSFQSNCPSRARKSLGPTACLPDHARPSLLRAWRRAQLPTCSGVLRLEHQSRHRSASTLAPGNQDTVGQGASHRASTSSVPRLGDKMSLPASGINTRPAPPARAYTPPPPNTNSPSTFFTDQIAKQQRGNFHSTSLRTVSTMVSQSVNKTALHPKGVEYVALVAV